jgi:hypothetical protein
MRASRKPQFFVIARRNDEAIRLLSGISGLLHFVRNDEIGLLRQPLHGVGNHAVVIGRLLTADPMFSSVSFVCSPEIKTTNDEISSDSQWRRDGIFETYL